MDDITKNINNYIKHNLRFTVKLSCLDKNMLPKKGRASGFIYLSDQKKYLLITASHILEDCNSWLIETTYTQNNQTLLLRLGDYTLLKKVNIHSKLIEPIDILIYELDLSKYKDVIERADLVFYKGSIDEEPKFGEAYGFASWSKCEFDANLNKLFLDAVYEISMEYIEEIDELYSFKLEKHKGHDYYYGSSGSPISDPSGQVISIVLSGDDKKNILYGLALRKFSSIINAL